MHFSWEFYFLVFAFLALIALSCASPMYGSYHDPHSKLKGHPYSEGFEPAGDASSLSPATIPEKTNTLSYVFSDKKLTGAAYGDTPYKSIDPLSTLKAAPECDTSSSGLSKSTGGVCLNKDIMSMIRGRGNADSA